MSFRNKLGNLILGKQAPVPYAGGWISAGQPVPARSSMEQFLRTYGELGWLFGCVSRIAAATAEIDWSLNRRKRDGSIEDVGDHPLKTLLNYPNPFQTGHDLIEMTQMYIDLTGEAYWYYSKEAGKPELWIVPPNKMTVIPDAKKFIAGYRYQDGAGGIPFSVDEIIPFIMPNPANPLRGVGPAQSIQIDLDTESFSAQTNRNRFYNNADPGTVISYKDSPPTEEIERLKEAWNTGHRGYGRAHRTAILTGGAELIRSLESNVDMDFVNMRKYNRDAILGAFGMPYSILGGSEHINRASAEAAQVTFARWVVRPRLVRIREKLNLSLAPRFGKDLELDFDDPVPEDRAQLLTEASEGVKAGFLTINEARCLMQLDAIPNGDVTVQPIMIQMVPIKGPVAEPALPIKAKSIFTEAQKEAYWQTWVKGAEAHEPKARFALETLWYEQRQEAVKNVQQAVNRNHVLVDVQDGHKRYRELMTPVMMSALAEAMQRGADLIKPRNPHRSVDGNGHNHEGGVAVLTKADPTIPQALNQAALEWLKRRIGWAAAEVGDETAALLAEQLGQGFDAGESIDQIARRIESVFNFNDSVRAERIARTEVLMASNEGALQGYADSGVVKEVEWYTARDERVCEICGPMQGDIEPVAEASGMIPAHPQCRCVWLPVVK